MLPLAAYPGIFINALLFGAGLLFGSLFHHLLSGLNPHSDGEICWKYYGVDEIYD